MSTKITAITRIKQVTRKEKNSTGEWEETTFEYKVIETLPYIPHITRMIHRFIDLIAIHLLFILFYFSIVFIYNLLAELSNLLVLKNDTEDLLYGILFVVTYFFSSFFYYLIFESIFGRTIGHFITGAMVLNEYGKKPSFKNVLIRSITRYTPLDSISSFENRAWHDLWSNTLVVHRKRYNSLILKLELEGILNNEYNQIEAITI